MLLLSLLIACGPEIASFHQRLDFIETAHGARSFANTVLPLERATEALNDAFDPHVPLGRDQQCDARIREAQALEFSRPKLYAELEAVPVPAKAMDATLTRRWITIMKRAGAALTPARRNELLRLQQYSSGAATEDRMAHLLGYQSWADYVDADRAVQTPMRVEKFLQTIDATLKPAADEQEQRLKDAFAASQGRRKRAMQPSDTPHAKELLEKRFGVDESQLRRWYPAQATRAKTFALFGNLFGVTITAASEPAWNPAVQTYIVADALSHKHLGTIYADIASANGPMQTITVVPGKIVAITGSQGDTLTHDDIIVFFHATGEALRQLLAATPYETLNSGVALDFATAPAQMCELFAWDPAALRAVASDQGADSIPDALIEKVAASRTLLAAYDANTVNGGEYEALWGRVYADDLFTAFSSGNVLDPAIGARFRQTILAPAGSLDPDTEVQNFLGRPVSPAAFYQQVTMTPQ